jgi:hypothetical protein
VSPTRRKYCSYPCQALGARLSQYGLDGWTFQELLRSQGGVCAVCRKALLFQPEVRPPSIDHDHATGKVRGILCQSCNIRVRWFEQAMKDGALVLAQHVDGFALKIARYLDVD